MVCRFSRPSWFVVQLLIWDGGEAMMFSGCGVCLFLPLLWGNAARVYGSGLGRANRLLGIDGYVCLIQSGQLY